MVISLACPIKYGQPASLFEVVVYKGASFLCSLGFACEFESPLLVGAPKEFGPDQSFRRSSRVSSGRTAHHSGINQAMFEGQFSG